MTPIALSDIPQDFKVYCDTQLIEIDRRVVSEKVVIALYLSHRSGSFTAAVLRNESDSDEPDYYIVSTLDWYMARHFFDMLEGLEERYVQIDPYKTFP